MNDGRLSEAYEPAATDPLPTGWRVPASLLLLAIPIIGAMISRTVMSTIDFVMVSQLGTEAQAAIGPATLATFCAIAFGLGATTSVATYVSQSLGRDRPADCSAYGWQGLWVSLLLGLVLLPSWFLVPAAFRWAGHEPIVQAMEVDYVRISLLSLGPATACFALANYFQGIHQPAVGLWSALIANAANVVGNLALIFGWWGFPALGVAGAAWATTGASYLQMLIMVAWMIRPAGQRQFKARDTWRWQWAKIKQIVWLGLPAGFQFSVDILTWTIFTMLLVGRFGTAQLAAHNVVFKFLEVSFMPTVGLGNAVTAAVGKAIGRRRPDHARLVTRWATLFATGYMGSVAVGYLIWRTELPSLLSSDPEVIQWASNLLFLAALFQLFDALGIVNISALRGAGDAHWPALVSIGYATVLFMGCGFAVVFLRPQLGAYGPWMVATLYIMLLGSTFWLRWLFGPWERIDLHGQAGSSR